MAPWRWYFGRGNEGDGMSDSTILASRRELAKPMPRVRLIPITAIIQAVSELTGGAASIPELLDSLHRRYDCETMMMYDGTGYGLAEAIDGNPFDEYDGFNKRADLTCSLFNSQYWIKPATFFLSKFNEVSPHDILMTKTDGLTLAMRLWEFFVPDQNFDYAHFKTLTSKAKEPALASDDTSPVAETGQGVDVDPLDLPVELDAANMAFRAVLNGHGEPTATFRNRLIDYLEKTFVDLNNETVLRIATVANPDKGRGRKKRETE